eukprot:612567-Prymnesium_polylepis.1
MAAAACWVPRWEVAASSEAKLGRVAAASGAAGGRDCRPGRRRKKRKKTVLDELSWNDAVCFWRYASPPRDSPRGPRIAIALQDGARSQRVRHRVYIPWDAGFARVAAG